MFFFKKNKNLKAFLTGELVSIDKVNDDVFSQKMMGDGIAIKPNDDKIYSPCDGTVEVVFEGSEHAIGIVMDNGLQVMIHCGLNTVNLTGICSSKVKKGDKVKAGQLIMTFDREKLKEENIDILKIYFCPHNEKDHCHCKKPKPGMIEQAKKDFLIDMNNSIYIGDSHVDYLLAKHFNLTFYGINYNGDNVKSYRSILEISKQIKKIQNK